MKSLDKPPFIPIINHRKRKTRINLFFNFRRLTLKEVVMRLSQIAIIALALGSLACFNCTPPEESLIIFEDTLKLVPYGYVEWRINDQPAASTHNSATAYLYEALTVGTRTGNYCPADQHWLRIKVWNPYQWSWTYINKIRPATASMGTGTTDSIKYSSTWTNNEYNSTQYIYEEWLVNDSTPAGYTYAEHIEAGVNGLEFDYGDVINCVWTLRFIEVGSSAGMELTDTFMYDIAYGMRYASAPFPKYAWLVFKNGDTSKLTTVNTAGAAQYTNLYSVEESTPHDAAEDTLLKVLFKNSSYKIVGWDTIKRYVGPNQRVGFIFITTIP